MNVSVSGSEITGIVTAPASKSVMQRACAAALLRGGEVIIHHYGKSNDDKAALNIIQQLGAEVTMINDHSLKIFVKNFPDGIPNRTISCGESGLSARMFTAIAALSTHTIKINGAGSLLQRPFDFFDQIFPPLNVTIKSNQGKLPLEIKGTLQPADMTIDGSLSSQFLTGLLFAFSALNEDAVIKVNHLNSRPYVDLTLEVMSDFGLNVPENKNYKVFVFQNSKFKIQNSKFNYTIEGDWSGAAFLLVAGAISGNVQVKGLNAFSSQADRAILAVLRQCGCAVSINEDAVTVSRNRLRPFQVDATNYPDLFPPLAALALFCNGTSIVSGVHRLTHKESNRAESIVAMCKAFGGNIFLQNDEMIIEGNQSLKPAIVNTFNDHRIAMAASVIALNLNGTTTIQDAECVNKSYPDFFSDIQSLGGKLS